jgi:hypothetical protein
MTSGARFELLRRAQLCLDRDFRKEGWILLIDLVEYTMSMPVMTTFLAPQVRVDYREPIGCMDIELSGFSERTRWHTTGGPQESVQSKPELGYKTDFEITAVCALVFHGN